MLFISYTFSYKTHFPCFVYVGLQLSTGQKSNYISGLSIIHRIFNTMILNFSIRLGSFSISRGHFLSLKNTTKASRPIKLNFPILVGYTSCCSSRRISQVTDSPSSQPQTHLALRNAVSANALKSFVAFQELGWLWISWNNSNSFFLVFKM